jgi:hypothetical protein
LVFDGLADYIEQHFQPGVLASLIGREDASILPSHLKSAV